MATSTNFSALTVLSESNAGGLKIRNISALGPASYGTGGAELDLTSDATDGLGTVYDGFNVVDCVLLGGVSPVASTRKYAAACYLRAAAGAAATGKVVIADLTAASDAEVSNATDLSATTFYFTVMGR